MRKDKGEIGVGDAVEVEVIYRRPLDWELTPTTAPLQPQPFTEWRPATVVHVDAPFGIGVAFSNGERLALPFRSNKWRPTHQWPIKGSRRG